MSELTSNSSNHETPFEKHLSAIEDRVEIGITPGEEIYAAFQAEVMQGHEAQWAIAAIKPIGSLEEYRKHNVYKRYHVRTDNPRLQAYYEEQSQKRYAELVEGRDLPVYLPAPRYTKNTYMAVDSMEEAVDLTRDVITARSFTDTYQARVGQADNIEDFAKRLAVATDPFCIAQALHPDRARVMGSTKYMHGLFASTLGFMRSHPDKAEEAFRMWEKRAAALAEDDLVKQNINGSGLVRRDFEGHVFVAVKDQNIYFQEPYFVEQFKNFGIGEPQKVAEVITALSMQNIQVEDATVQMLDKLEQDLLTEPPQGKAKLMQSGIDLLINNFSLAQQFSQSAGKILEILDAKKASGRGLGIPFVIKLANAFYKPLEERRQQAIYEAQIVEIKEATTSLKLLDENSVADLPKAIDRLCAIVQAEVEGSDANETTKTIVEKMSHVSSLVAEIGAERKLDETVLTVGDLVMRYPLASPEQVRELIEAMQTSRSEAAVHDVYRDLRTIHKNRAKFKKWTAGKGLLT